MAFSIKTWVDRVVEHTGRKALTNVDTGERTVVDVTRNEGTVTTKGDAFSAANMNDLEQRISEAFGGFYLSLNSDSSLSLVYDNGE